MTHESEPVTHEPEPRRGDVSEAVAEPALAVAGDRPAAEPFEALYRRAFPRVYAYVATLLRDRSAAEEVTAQAFERAYRKRSTYRAGRGTPEAWLFGIARNAALDELRRLKRRATLEGEPEGAAGDERGVDQGQVELGAVRWGQRRPSSASPSFGAGECRRSTATARAARRSRRSIAARET